MKGKEIKGWLKAPLNDDLGGLPSRTVLSEEPLMPFAIDPHPPVAPQGLVLAGAPRRVDARTKELNYCTTCRKFQCASREIG